MDCLHDMSNVEILCRICLTADDNNISLGDAFERNRKDSPSVFWALEKVMSMKLILDKNYPFEICLNCLSLLNMSYSLREQFENSQEILKEHFTKCLENIMENDDDNIVSSQEFITAGESDLLTPKLEVYTEENNENVEYVYEENIEKLEEYLDLKMDQENTEQSGEEEFGLIQTDDIEESDESSDKINEPVQIDSTSYRRNKELQIKQLDIDKYIIEKPVENPGISLTSDHDVKNLSSLDEELIQAAYNLKYECPGCPKLYSSLRNLNKHKEVCVKLKRLAKSQSQPTTINRQNTDADLFEEDYECDRCFKSYLSSNELEEHKETEHSESKLNVYEAFKLEDLSELDQELFRGALLLKYECDTCPKVYSSPDKLEKHKAICEKLKRKSLCKSNTDANIIPTQPDGEEDKLVKFVDLSPIEEINLDNLTQAERDMFQSAVNLQYKCPNCGKFYSTEVRFKRHLMICESKRTSKVHASPDKLEKHKVFWEKLEGKSSSKLKTDAKITPTQPDGEENKSPKLISFTDFSSNEEIDLENLPQAEKDMFQSALNLQHKCPNCGKFYSSEDRFKKHMMTCESEETSLGVYSCEICGHISTSKINDFYHKETAHKEKKYTCEKCGKLFAVKSVLKRHMQSHAKDKTQVICPICGKGFHYTGGLFYHMKMHKKELNYLCDYCERRFINLNALKRHLATHTGERRYQCKVCDKKFKGSTELRRHELQHTGSRPHRCHYCGKGCVSKSNLQYHIISHKGNVPCDRCGRMFLDADVLRMHMKIKHKVQEENPLFTP